MLSENRHTFLCHRVKKDNNEGKNDIRFTNLTSIFFLGGGEACKFHFPFKPFVLRIFLFFLSFFIVCFS